jgi:hypothetical protein
MDSVDLIQVPVAEARDERRRWRAHLIIFAGMVTVGACVISGQAVPALWPLTVPLGVGGLVLLYYGLARMIQATSAKIRSNIRVARARTAQEPSATRAPSGSVSTVRAGVILRADQLGSAGRLPVYAIAFSALIGLAVSAGLAEVLLVPADLTVGAVLILVLVGAIIPLVLLLGDINRGIPGLFERASKPAVFLSETGVDGLFYPTSTYHSEPEGYTIRSPWFHLVKARLPTPNHIPWRLLMVTAPKMHSEQNTELSILSLSSVELPWWVGGLSVGPGFLPSGGVGDPRLGSGLIVTVWRSELDQVLWWALQGGSRLVAEYGQLSQQGRRAVEGATLAGNSRLNRPLNSSLPWFVWLPPPSSPEELSSWLI